MPKISVVVPVYNLEQQISRCLESILAQSHNDIEIVVVDDGSLDGSAKIINEFAEKDSRIKPIFKENGGVMTARLCGIKAATGEYIGFVDGDDYIDIDMYEILIKNALKYNADISHCGYKMLFDDGRINHFYNTQQTIIQDNKKGIIDLLDGVFIEPGLCNKLFRRELFKKIIERDTFYPEIRINEDLLMNYFLFKESKKSIFYDICPYNYIKPYLKNAKSKVLNDHQVFDPVRVRKVILDFSDNSTLDCARKSYVNSCLDSCNAIVLSGISNNKESFFKSRKLLKEQKCNFDSIGKKRKFMAWFVLTSPRIYCMFYRFYVRFLQKNKYI